MHRPCHSRRGVTFTSNEKTSLSPDLKHARAFKRVQTYIHKYTPQRQYRHPLSNSGVPCCTLSVNMNLDTFAASKGLGTFGWGWFERGWCDFAPASSSGVIVPDTNHAFGVGTLVTWLGSGQIALTCEIVFCVEWGFNRDWNLRRAPRSVARLRLLLYN